MVAAGADGEIQDNPVREHCLVANGTGRTAAQNVAGDCDVVAGEMELAFVVRGESGSLSEAFLTQADGRALTIDEHAVELPSGKKGLFPGTARICAMPDPRRLPSPCVNAC